MEAAERPEATAGPGPELGSTASSREELAPGTPAQQSPPVMNGTPPPANVMSPLFTFPAQRHQMHQQNSMLYMMPKLPNGVSGPPPPPQAGISRPGSSRDDHRMRISGPAQVVLHRVLEYVLSALYLSLLWLSLSSAYLFVH